MILTIAIDDFVESVKFIFFLNSAIFLNATKSL